MLGDKVMTTATAVPKPPVSPRPEALDIFDDSIEAKPLGADITEGVKKKNPNIELRWVNHVAGEGLRLNQMIAKGWVVATPTDVEVPGVPFKDGAFKCMDLILMKHDRRAVLGARKYNVLRAMELSGNRNVLENGRGRLRHELSDSGAPQEVKSKMSVFVPGQRDVENLPGMSDKSDK